jgi:branched-chain amino acid transport system permease protein
LGSQSQGVDQLIYGALLILFIIYMPKGILGTLLARFGKKPVPGQPSTTS